MTLVTEIPSSFIFFFAICEVSFDFGLSSTIRQSSEKEVADRRGCGRGILFGFVRTPLIPPFCGIFLSVRIR